MITDWKLVWKLAYEDPPADPPKDPPPPPEKTFSQEQLNKILADEKRKFQETQRKLLAELDSIKENAKLTEADKIKFEETTESLRNELLTKEQLAAKERDRLANEHRKQLDSATADAKKWQVLFESTTIDRHLMDAAIKHKAYNPSHIMALLRGNTKLVEDIGEDGKSTGAFVPKVRIPSTKDGKPITLEFTADEAVKFLSEQEDNKNLFRGDGTGGVGATNQTGKTGKVDMRELAKDPAAYREWSKKNL